MADGTLTIESEQAQLSEARNRASVKALRIENARLVAENAQLRERLAALGRTYDATLAAMSDEPCPDDDAAEILRQTRMVRL